MSNNETPVIRGQVLEAGLTALDSDNAYNRINVTVTERQLAEYPRNLFRLNVVIIAADDYDAMLKMQEEERDRAIALMKSLEVVDEVPTQSICKHCGQPIRINGEGSWVHEDEDDDPQTLDYGWVACLPMDEKESTTAAEPIEEN